jgi:ParB family protein of integrating conjugative element (PFGI_1 class)
MAMKRILPDIGAMLREGHFGDPKSEMPPPADPVTVTQMVLEVSRIEPYDRNPRQEANPRYAEIKESIRAQRGLNNALEITRRPGAEHYMIRAGGNTRLQILKELLDETGDSAFAKVHCLFHPWTSDTDVLTAHMIENELRGEMSLIDKALGLQALKAEIEAETGEQLSRSELVRKLADAGYTISRRHLSRFQYTTEALYPLIPTALRSGMGQPQIDALRALETAFQSYWTDAGRESDRFQTIWKDALLMVDGPDFDVTLARQNLETRLSGVLGHPVSRIRIAVDALLSGRAGATEGPDDGTDPAAETEPLPDVSLAPPEPRPIPLRMLPRMNVRQPRRRARTGSEASRHQHTPPTMRPRLGHRTAVLGPPTRHPV